jgi:hypothetical protein
MKVRIRHRCAVCGEADGIQRSDGRYVCKSCWIGGEDYRSHWFVKSLQYAPDRIVKKRTRKPLPGQQEFPFPENEGEHPE